jgi:catechol 2,3-dioxygenase-like lactoylglutathione lyase family enzyme
MTFARRATSTTSGSAWPTSRRRAGSTTRSRHTPGFRLSTDTPERVQFVGASGSFSVVAGPHATEHLHMAFAADDDDDTVAEFHRAATAAGQRDNGAPGERPEYHPGYYAAFVLDPDGNNVEVVNHNR